MKEDLTTRVMNARKGTMNNVGRRITVRKTVATTGLTMRIVLLTEIAPAALVLTTAETTGVHTETITMVVEVEVDTRTAPHTGTNAPRAEDMVTKTMAKASTEMNSGLLIIDRARKEDMTGLQGLIRLLPQVRTG
ncbi:hypothetical protein FACS1894181_17810 [Bacteroidia bacterium]|nr:hypothetical protein FACS1894181_17810 [Bacteroidia bacterium]